MDQRITATRIQFEYHPDPGDGEPGFYEHKHTLDITEHQLAASEFAGQLDAQAEQIETVLEQQMMEAGIGGVGVSFDVSIIDDSTIGVVQRATAPDNVPGDDFFQSAVAGEASQLIGMLQMAGVDAETIEDVREMIDSMLDAMVNPPADTDGDES